MRHLPTTSHDVHTADTGAAQGRGMVRGARVRACGGGTGIAHPFADVTGSAVTPRIETLVLARGTHRTRVSEMRLAAARAATLRPDVPGGVRHAATERDRGARVRQGTG